MTDPVAVPLWLFAILAVLAAWTVFDRLVVPGTRWIVRRRARAVLDEVDRRLAIRIPRFKLTRRPALIERLFHDPRVQEVAEAYARERNLSSAEVLRSVDRYAREIVPSFNAYLYFRVGYWVARAFVRSLFRLRLGYVDEAALARIEPGSTIVFVMNHRSNMDYVLVAFLAAEHTALSYAVGEWARIWPLETLIRSMGAFFVRRSSGDPLYRIVLQRYVQMATEAGVPQAVFPEGGLSVDGRLRAPRLGLIDYMVKAFDPAGVRDLVFVPVGINYDRVLEDRSLILKLDPQAARPGIARAVGNAAVFAARNLRQMLTGRWHRFGYACVNFGTPISMREYVRSRGSGFRELPEAERKAAVERLGGTLLEAIGSVVPVLPVALVAGVFAARPGAALSELEVKSAAFGLMETMRARGAWLYVPRSDQDYAIAVGLRMLTLRRIVAERGGLYTAHAEEGALIAYYANSIAHLLPKA